MPKDIFLKLHRDKSAHKNFICNTSFNRSKYPYKLLKWFTFGTFNNANRFYLSDLVVSDSLYSNTVNKR